MKLSIIIPTLGNSQLLASVISSITESTLVDYEIVLVNQGPKFLFSSIENINEYVVCFKGLSRAKNYGAQKAKGDYILFLDDDACLIHESVEIINGYLNTKIYDVIFGKVTDENGRDSVKKFGVLETEISIKNYHDKFIESSMLVTREVMLEVLFDEDFGVGTFFGAEEGRDWIIRAIHKGLRIKFDPNLNIFHPQVIFKYDHPSIFNRVVSYRLGFGALCKKHSLYFELFYRLLIVFCGCLYFLFVHRMKFKYYRLEFLAILLGFFKYSK